jgi:hypothetical protein
VALTAFAGLTIDAGYLQLIKTRMQTAADAAALGGAQEIHANGSTNAAGAARTDAAANGFTDGIDTVAITVNTPPTSGFSTADSTAVEVIITKNVPSLFMSVLGFASATVHARAVAKLGSSPTCMYVLDPSASNAFQISGGVNLQMSCGVFVNSSSSSALQASGGAHVTAGALNVVGDYSSSGGATLSPTPSTHSAPQRDPLAYLKPPAIGSCTSGSNYSVSGGATATLAPGVYCKGISISGGSKVTFNPGVYILLGGGLNISSATVTGAGVTFYNTSASGKPYGNISFSGGASANLSAPTTGPLAGILFYQDKNASPSAGSDFSGGASVALTGALYFPTTSVSYSGGTGAAYTLIVSSTISFSGGSALNSDYSSLPGGSPIKGGATLSE